MKERSARVIKHVCDMCGEDTGGFPHELTAEWLSGPKTLHLCAKCWGELQAFFSSHGRYLE